MTRPTNVIPPATVVAPKACDPSCCQGTVPSLAAKACMLGSWTWFCGFSLCGQVGLGVDPSVPRAVAPYTWLPS